MADLQLDIDGIVREVLRRLREAGALATAGAASAKLTARIPETRASQVSAPQVSADRQILQLPDRVVTLELLRDRLSGITQVQVAQGALVTPAVRDELNKRQVKLIRGGQPPAASRPTAPGLLVGIAAASQERTAWLDNAAADVGSIQAIGGSGLVEVIHNLTQAVVAQRMRGVLLTGLTAAAVCLANRRPGVRAALGHSVGAVTEAVRSIGANLLVLDPTAHSVFQLRRMMRELAHAETRDCPAEIQAALEGSQP